MMEADRSDRTPDFDDLVTRSLDTRDPRVPPGRWRKLRSRNRSVVARGFYGHQLARGLELFPGEQWLLLDFVDFAKDQATVMRRVTDFLGIDPYTEPPSAERVRASTPLPDTGPGNPSALVLQRLAAAYADDLRQFEDLSGISTEHWPTTRLLRGDLDSQEWAAQLRRKARHP
jgi:hypothetical protein